MAGTPPHRPDRAGTEIERKISMKQVKVTFIWKGDCTFEVPDDWTVPSTLSGFTSEQLDEVSPVTAELVDWKKA